MFCRSLVYILLVVFFAHSASWNENAAPDQVKQMSDVVQRVVEDPLMDSWGRRPAESDSLAERRQPSDLGTPWRNQTITSRSRLNDLQTTHPHPLRNRASTFGLLAPPRPTSSAQASLQPDTLSTALTALSGLMCINITMRARTRPPHTASDPNHRRSPSSPRVRSTASRTRICLLRWAIRPEAMVIHPKRTEPLTVAV
jgi:hypothetical protein